MGGRRKAKREKKGRADKGIKRWQEETWARGREGKGKRGGGDKKEDKIRGRGGELKKSRDQKGGEERREEQKND